MKSENWIWIVVIGVCIFSFLSYTFNSGQISNLQTEVKELKRKKKLDMLELQAELNNMESLKELNERRMESDFRTIDTFITKLEMLKKFQDKIASGELQRAIESVVKESNRIKNEMRRRN